jgi:hypothetical protein
VDEHDVKSVLELPHKTFIYYISRVLRSSLLNIREYVNIFIFIMHDKG